jgi:hypothetical protein
MARSLVAKAFQPHDDAGMPLNASATPMIAPPLRWYVVALLAVTLVIASIMSWRVHAITLGALTLERIDGEGWSANGITMEIDMQAEPIKARAHINRLEWLSLGKQPARVFRNVSIECAQLKLQTSIIECNDARINGAFPSLGEQSASGRLRFNRETKALWLELSGVKVGGGVAKISGDWRKGAWSAQLQLQHGKVEALHALAKTWLPDVPAVDISGELDVDVRLQGRAANVTQIVWRINARKLIAGNSAGTLATDQLTFESQGSVDMGSFNTNSSSQKVWRFKASLSSAGGQAYAEPIFLNFQDHPIQLSAEGEWRIADKQIALQKFVIAHAKALAASGHATLALGDSLQIQQLHVDIGKAELPGVYTAYLQPFLLDSALGSLTTRGSVSGTADIVANAPTALALDLTAVSAEDTQRRWSVNNLSGAVRWQKQQRDNASRSMLQWQRAQVWGIDIGAADIHFVTEDRHFAMTEAAHIPVLDGSMQIATLEIQNAGLPQMALQLDATLQPIGMPRLSKAFGWPTFGGRFGGRLTNLQLRDGTLTLGTALQAEVFDGRVTIADLRLERALSNWPRLSANIDIDNVDLEQVTTAFSFGGMTGRLSGKVNGLRMFNWMPVAFDAQLYTPRTDRSRHRISQRAVQSIGKLGGSGAGIGAALSSGFMRFFDEFNYDRVGIGCRLENDVCFMNGVEPAPNGYYLVKGRGVPRIDVIGNSERVDWPRLVAQLKAATTSGGIEVR